VSDPRRAIVFGGSSGIGLAAARILVGSGASVGLVARDGARLEAARVRLAGGPGAVAVASADVRDAQAVTAAVGSLVAALGGLDLALVSAGEAYAARLNDTPAGVARTLVEVNYLGSVHAARAVIPALEASGGRLSFVSSLAGVMGIYGYSAYAPSKFALTGFAECLRQELKPRGVRVSVLFPPDTDTPQLAAENRAKPPETRAISGTIRPRSADEVARAWISGIDADRAEIFTDFESRASVFLCRAWPSLFRAIVDRRIAGVQGGRE
jgi:3-dehydrosphinganine reductase